MPAVVSKIRSLLPLLGDQVGNAAHAVATGAGLGTVIVENPDEGVGAGRAGLINSHQLIVRCAIRTGSRTRLGGLNFGAARAHIDNNDLVADAVHFYEGLVGERAHILFCPGFARFIWRINAD